MTRDSDVPGLPNPTGPYSWTVRDQDLVFVSGLRGLDPATGRPVEGDEARMGQIMHLLAQALSSAGSSLSEVLSTTLYVTDMARHRPIANAAYLKFFGTELPTRTIVEVDSLNQGDSIELEVIAAGGRVEP